MKVFKRILLVIGIIIFVLSVSLSVMLAMSTTYGIVIKDNLKSKEKIVTRTYMGLDDDDMYINYKTVGEKGDYVLGQIVCSMVEEEVKCKMIEKEYDEKSTLIRTNYMPGDGYKYVLEGKNKYKSVYTDYNIELVAKEYLELFDNGMGALLDESDEEDNYFVEFDTKLKLDFSDFELRKIIEVEITDNEEKETFKIEVNGQDCVDKIIFENEGYIELKDKAIVLSFPSFEDYK